MFGHVKGAFSGAVRDKPGLLEAATGGTVFLDELTEMSQSIQARLLRVIQDGVVRRMGSEAADAVVNVRFVAATSCDAQEVMESGVLRKDLFYRLSVVPLRLPPLRERVEDISLLAEHFLAMYWKRHRERSAALPRLGPAAIQELESRDWSGNVGELQNVIEHAVVLLEPGCEIQPEDLPGGDGLGVRTGGAARADGWRPPTSFGDGGYYAERERVLEEFELSYLGWLEERSAADPSRAAEIAGLELKTLYRLMDKYRLRTHSALG